MRTPTPTADAKAIIVNSLKALKVSGLFAGKSTFNAGMLSFHSKWGDTDLDEDCEARKHFKALRKVNTNVCRACDAFERELKKAYGRIERLGGEQ